MKENNPIYKGGWQFGDTIRQELAGPIGEGQVLYPNGDRFDGYFHLSFASINGPAYAAEGRYTFSDGSYIEKAWIDTSSDRTVFDLHGVFRIHHPQGHESIAMFIKNKRMGFELVLTEKPYTIEWYDNEQLRELEVESYNINEPYENCLTLTITLMDGTRIVQRGGRYTSNNYNQRIYEPHVDVTVYFPDGNSVDKWGWGLLFLEPYDGYITVHNAETQMCRKEKWKEGTRVKAEEWRRDLFASKKLRLPNPLGEGETDARLWKDGHIEYEDDAWIYDGEVKDDRPEGRGTLVGGEYSHKGESYVGEFHEGRAHGQGVFENTKAGIRQEGTFVNGEYQEPNAATEPIILHAHHGHSSWSISSQSDWKYTDSDFEAKLDSLSFSGFGDIKIARIEKDCITLTDYNGNVKELHPGETIHYSAEIEGREWSDGCVYDGDDYSLDLTWTDMKIEHPQSAMETTFEITHDREFLKHFLTRWRTLSISPEMVERLKNSDDYYACYGYGRWLSCANPDGQSIKEAEEKLMLAANYGYLPDAYAALAEMHYNGKVASDKADPEQHAFLMYKASTEGSELCQYQELDNIIYGNYGFKEDPEEAADILKKHLEKHPDCDPIYWDLLGLAVEKTDKDEAIKCLKKSIEMGNTESYYSLARILYNNGNKALARQYVEEGKLRGAVNCHRAMANFVTFEDFMALSEEEQKKFHEEIDQGLRYAVAHYDRYACYILAFYLYYGQMGYEANTAEAMHFAQRGCELGEIFSFELLAQMHDEDENIPKELRISQKEVAKLYLQTLRHENLSEEALEKVARAYVANLLPNNNEEIEKLWLPKYYEQRVAKDESPDLKGIIRIYPQGYIYVGDVEQDSLDSLSELAEIIHANGVDVVHYSDLLNRMSKVLCRGEHNGCHIAMLVDRDGYAKDLPDNMTGTILYGHDWEVRGTVMLVLEDDKYNLLPPKGLAFFDMCLRMLDAATGGLTRMPTEEEMERIESGFTDEFEEYDDPYLSFLDFDTEKGEETPVEEEEEEPVVEEDENAEPKNITVKLADIKDAIAKCNLCRDTITAILPKEPDYYFKRTDELMYPIKDAVEKNIERHGGYMIDEWQYVYKDQAPTDIRYRVRFKMEEDD